MPPASPVIPPAQPPRRKRGRFLRFLGVLALAAVLLVVAGGLFLRYGTNLPTPEPAPSAASPAAPLTPSAGPSAGATADGCLGGSVEVDRAVITAQERAGLDEAGAAAFVATLLRWGLRTPASVTKPETAERVVAAEATEPARSLGEIREEPGATTAVDFAQGRFFVEGFDGTTAVVSVIARATGTKDGQAYAPALLYPTVTIVAQDGVWRVQDYGGTRSLEDLQGISVPYTGGC